MQPIALVKLLSYFNNTGDVSRSEAFYWCLGLMATVFSDCIISHPVSQGLYHIGMKIRLSISSLIYRKVLRMSRWGSEEGTNVGKVNILIYIFIKLYLNLPEKNFHNNFSITQNKVERFFSFIMSTLIYIFCPLINDFK